MFVARFAKEARRAVFGRKIGHAMFPEHLRTAMGGSAANGSCAQRLHEPLAAHRPRDLDLIVVALQ